MESKKKKPSEPYKKPRKHKWETVEDFGLRLKTYYHLHPHEEVSDSHKSFIMAYDKRDADYKIEEKKIEFSISDLSKPSAEIVKKAIESASEYVESDSKSKASTVVNFGLRAIHAITIADKEYQIKLKLLSAQKELEKETDETTNTWAAPIPSRKLIEPWKPGKKLSEITAWHYGHTAPLFVHPKSFNAKQRVIFQPHYRQHEIAKTILDDPHKYICCVFSRRFGKSILIAALADMICQNENYWNTNGFGKKPTRATVMVTGTTHQQLYKIYFEGGIIQNIFGNRADCEIQLANRCIKFNNGSIITFAGADANGSREGRSYNFIFVDEAAVTDKLEQFVESSLKAMILDWKGKLVLIGSPKSAGSDFEKYAMKGDSANSGWITLRGTSLENPHNDLEELQRSIDSMDEETAGCEYMCKFMSATGAVFRFQKERNVSKEVQFNPKIPLDIIFDFNVHNYSILFGQVHKDFTGKKRLHIIDEYRPKGSFDTDRAVHWILTQSPYAPNKFSGEVRLFGDATGSADKTSSAGYTDWSIIEQNLRKGIKFNNTFHSYALVSSHVEASNPRGNKFIDSINSVNSALDPMNRSPRLFINPKCEFTIRDLQTQKWDEERRRPDKSQEDDGIGHFSDCVRYWTHSVDPIHPGVYVTSNFEEPTTNEEPPVFKTASVIA